MRRKFTIPILSIVLCLFVQVNGYGQGIADSLVLYDSEYQFVEGVYMNFESVRTNSPIPKSRILSNYNYADKDFFDKVLSQNKFYNYDNIGNKIERKTKNVWGYSRNGFLYINVNDDFYRITLIGSICHFIAYRTYQSYNNSYNSSYYSAHPQLSNPSSTSTEMQQFLLDFNTGNILEYSVEGIEVLLMPDPELHDEYSQLSKKKKKQMKFVYLRRFNDRNPLFLIKK